MKVDERLLGTFISDKDTTIKYLVENKLIDMKRLRIFDQMFGRLNLEFHGPKVRVATPSYTIKNYFKNGDDFKSEALVKDNFFVQRTESDNSLFLYVFEGKIWDLSEVAIYFIEFNHDGFWLTNTERFGYSCSKRTVFKEKFKRCSPVVVPDKNENRNKK